MDLVAATLLRKGDYVFGSFLKPEAVDGYINSVNPGDRGDVIGRFPFSVASVDEAVVCAGRAARVWARQSVEERAAAVRRFADQLGRGQERLARIVVREIGKPLWEARQEVGSALRALEQMARSAPKDLEPEVADEIAGRCDRVPRGVVAIVVPYPMPVFSSAVQSAAALLGGNAVVLKPSKYSPASGQTVAELWDRCKLPRGALNLVQGPGSAVGHRLVAHPGIDAIVFSGSWATARAIRKSTSDRPELPAVMSCGGKGTALVLDDAEIDRAVHEVLVGAFLTAGQRHNSTGRALVTARVWKAFTERLVARARRVGVGYGLDDAVFMGPLVSENFRSRYKRFGRALAEQGCPALVPVGTVDGTRKGFYVRPAAYEVPWEKGPGLLDEEPPGPTLLLYKVADWQEAVALHEQIAHRVATSVFTRPDNAVLPEIRERLRTGALNVNRGTIGASIRLATAGLGRSSNGVPTGPALVGALTSPRAQMVESRPLSELAGLPGLPPDDDEESTVIEDDVADVSAALEATAE